MLQDDEFQKVEINSLILDDENPRFASSMLVQNVKEITQNTIIKHLLRYADIQDLAQRINFSQGLHKTEIIACYKHNDKYVVLEGNRRICACKPLFDRSLIPTSCESNFPFATKITKENIEKINVYVYPNREAVYAYLSDRHITGVKKWSALEKNNYYMNLFQTHGTLEKVKEFTSDPIAVVKKSIVKYQFFMDVFMVLQTKHETLEIEKLDYLPMVDRFMDILVGDSNYKEVGLFLELNDKTLKLSPALGKENKYKEILMLIGEAFLIRENVKNPAKDDISKIISTEIPNREKQRELIMNDKRISGLLSLIKNYKEICSTENTCIINDRNNSDQKPSSSYKDENEPSNVSAGDIFDSHNVGAFDNQNDEESKKYIPSKQFSRNSSSKYLSFTEDESFAWDITGDSDFERRISGIIRELALLSVHEYPNACIGLYRFLLEICTKFVYKECSAEIKKEHDENNLQGNMKYLTNNVLFKNGNEKKISKLRKLISNHEIINSLNTFIHYEYLTDVGVILNSWNIMKFYVQACLKKATEANKKSTDNN